MFQIEEIQDLKGPKGLPDWLGDAVSWFVQQGKGYKIALIRAQEEGNKDCWTDLGETLFREMFSPSRELMVFLDGTFPDAVLDSWVAHLNGDAMFENDNEGVFNYTSSTLKGPTMSHFQSRYVTWTSVTTYQAAPFGPDVFSLIPSEVPNGCDIIFASPRTGVMNLAHTFAMCPVKETILQNMGSWISPIEDYMGYCVGILEGEPGWESVFGQA